MVRPADGRPGVKMVELKAVEPRFPLYGTLTLESGTYSHALLRGGGVLVRPELLAQFRLKVGRSDLHRDQRVRDSRRHQGGAGPKRRRLQHRTAGADRLRRRAVDRAAVVRQPRLATAAAASCRTPARRRPMPNLRAAFANEFVRGRGYWSNADRMGQNLAAGRELPEPGRPGRADSRRYRRVERDARLRPAEGAQHRHPEVRRQHDRHASSAST